MDGLGLAPGLYSSLNSDKGLAVAGLPCLVNLGTFTACYFVWDSTCVFLVPRIPGGTEIMGPPFSQGACLLVLGTPAHAAIAPGGERASTTPPRSRMGVSQSPPAWFLLPPPSLFARLGSEHPWAHPKNWIYPQKIKIVVFEDLPKDLQKGLT